MSGEISEGPKAMVWGGYVMTALPVLLLCFSAYMKLSSNPQAVEGAKAMGLADGVMFWIGVAELACTVLYVIPFTAVLGAILLTGYLGGAVFVHVLGGEPLYMPILLGVLLWGGLFLRDARVRALMPLTRRH